MSNGYLKIALKIDRSPLHQSNHMDISTLEDFLTNLLNQLDDNDYYCFHDS